VDVSGRRFIRNIERSAIISGGVPHMRNGGWCRHQPPLSQFLLAKLRRAWRPLPGGSGFSLRIAASASSLSHFRRLRFSPAGLSLESGFGLRLSLLPRTCPLPLPSATLRRAGLRHRKLRVRTQALLLRPFPFAFPSLALQLRWTAWGKWVRLVASRFFSSLPVLRCPCLHPCGCRPLRRRCCLKHWFVSVPPLPATKTS
jgi:hypothetical protein